MPGAPESGGRVWLGRRHRPPPSVDPGRPDRRRAFRPGDAPRRRSPCTGQRSASRTGPGPTRRDVRRPVAWPPWRPELAPLPSPDRSGPTPGPPGTPGTAELLRWRPVGRPDRCPPGRRGRLQRVGRLRQTADRTPLPRRRPARQPPGQHRRRRRPVRHGWRTGPWCGRAGG